MPDRRAKKVPVVKIRDVARECGVSITTVSVVLNGAPLSRYIAADTKERIKKAAKALGYRPNVMARFLRSSRSHTVGVMFFDVTDPFCTPILRGVENTLFKAGYVPIVADARNEGPRFERSLEMMLQRQVEGLIVVANWLFVDIKLLGDLPSRDLPTVIIGWEGEAENIGSVMVDNEAGARQAMEHLYVLGHRSIAFIRGPKTLVDSGQRWNGVQAFANSVGLKIDPRLVVELPDRFDPNLGFKKAHRLTEQLLRSRRDFTALVAFDDLTAMGAIRALTEAGIKVPEQCSVVGFDDVAPAALLTPSLTTIRQPLERMGTMATSLVMERLGPATAARTDGPRRYRLLPELVVRDSSAAPAAKV